VDEMIQSSGVEIMQLNVDGGASINDLLMQLQADLLKCEVVRPKITETTALGAALLAGLAVGFWKDYHDIKKRWSVDKSFRSNEKTDTSQVTKYWNKALERTKNWIED
jgi:glycerol kinase